MDKRISLVIPIIYGLLLYYFNILYNNVYFFYIGLFINICIIFLNIPFFVTVLHTTPVYYEDLVLISNVTDTQIHSLQNIFTTLNSIFTSAFITLSIFYILSYHELNNYSYLEILAFIGGLGSINLKLQAYIGKGLLTILYKVKNRRKILIPDEIYDNLSSNPSSDIVNIMNRGKYIINDNSDNNINISDNSNNIGGIELERIKIRDLTPVSHISSPSNIYSYMDDISRVTNKSVLSNLWSGKHCNSPINRSLCNSPINRSHTDLVSLSNIEAK